MANLGIPPSCGQVKEKIDQYLKRYKKITSELHVFVKV